jgi:hypothetical protein
MREGRIGLGQKIAIAAQQVAFFCLQIANMGSVAVDPVTADKLSATANWQALPGSPRGSLPLKLFPQADNFVKHLPGAWRAAFLSGRCP